MDSLYASGGWGGPHKLFLSFFFLLSGQVMVLVTSGFVHGMSPMGGAAVDSVVFATRTHIHTPSMHGRTQERPQGRRQGTGSGMSDTPIASWQLGYEVRAEWAFLTCKGELRWLPNGWGGCGTCRGRG